MSSIPSTAVPAIMPTGEKATDSALADVNSWLHSADVIVTSTSDPKAQQAALKMLQKLLERKTGLEVNLADLPSSRPLEAAEAFIGTTLPNAKPLWEKLESIMKMGTDPTARRMVAEDLIGTTLPNAKPLLEKIELVMKMGADPTAKTAALAFLENLVKSKTGMEIHLSAGEDSTPGFPAPAPAEPVGDDDDDADGDDVVDDHHHRKAPPVVFENRPIGDFIGSTPDAAPTITTTTSSTTKSKRAVESETIKMLPCGFDESLRKWVALAQESGTPPVKRSIESDPLSAPFTSAVPQIAPYAGFRDAMQFGLRSRLGATGAPTTTTTTGGWCWGVPVLVVAVLAMMMVKRGRTNKQQQRQRQRGVELDDVAQMDLVEKCEYQDRV